VAVRPAARGLKPAVDGRRIRFRLDRPGQITVEVNGWHQALHLFANPPQTALPGEHDPGVRYFGPGVHRPGKIRLQSHETLVVAGGAVVYGAVDVSEAEDVRILGRGIIDTSGFERGQGGGCLRLTHCRNVTVEGVILRDPDEWCFPLFGCAAVVISNVKLIGLWRYNADGIDVCNSEDVTIRDCFIRSFDDSIVVKGLARDRDRPVRRVLAERCVIWNDWGRALEVGAETCAPEITDLTFRDCDIIRTAHIAMDIQHGDRATVRGVRFEKIRLEIDEVSLPGLIQKGTEDTYRPPDKPFCPALLVVEIVNTMWSADKVRGTAEDITVRDITVTDRSRTPAGPAGPRSRLSGCDAAHRVSGVTIAGLSVNGRPLRSLAEAGITVGPYVDDVRFVVP
jgi:hypothetical protein